MPCGIIVVRPFSRVGFARCVPSPSFSFFADSVSCSDRFSAAVAGDRPGRSFQSPRYARLFLSPLFFIFLFLSSFFFLSFPPFRLRVGESPQQSSSRGPVCSSPRRSCSKIRRRSQQQTKIRQISQSALCNRSLPAVFGPQPTDMAGPIS